MHNDLMNPENIHIPDALKFLVKGYVEYTKEVVTDRAIEGIDGFKPSQRRIAYTMRFLEKVKDLTKSHPVAGAVLKLHPHGDASVYDTMVRMVESSEHMNMPFLKGKGGFGKVYSSEPPAAARYTNVMLHPFAEVLFGEMDGVRMMPSYDNKHQEPELLPTSVPNILYNASSGIAVGISSNKPSFNPTEVNNATIELIETGDISTLLVPDFTTKGYYVYNEKELRKIMETGRGKIKLRGKWHIDGKTIIIDELPYYTTIDAVMGKSKKDKKKEKKENLKRKIEDIPGVADVRDATDRINGLRIEIECTSKRNVEEVLNEVLRTTDLQMTITSNIVVIINNKPRVIGVKELLREWVAFRKNVLLTSYQKELDYLNTQIPQYEVLVALLGDDEKRSQFTETLAKLEQGELKARELLKQWYPTVDNYIFDWILDMKLKQFTGLNKRVAQLNGLKVRKAEVEQNYNNVEKVIVQQLKDFNSKYTFPRKTEITNKDYVFENNTSELVVKAEAVPVVVQVEGKFIKKIRKTRITENLEGTHCMSDDVISFIDSQGRLLRVALDNIEFVSERDRGVYLPVYLEVEDDFEIMAYELISDKIVGYVYSDGFASVVDYNEWVDSKRTTRITQNGVSPLAHLIIGEIDFEKNFLLLFTKSGKFGFTSTEFKHKNRTARTKLINVKGDDEIVTVIPLSYTDIMKLVPSPEKYMDKLSLLSHGDTFNSEYLQTLTQ